MCGRYSVAVSGTALVDILELDGTEPGFDWSPTYSVAPRTRAPVIRDRLIEDQRVREGFLPTWGLRPSWAKEKAATINDPDARSTETSQAQPSTARLI